MRWVVLGLIFLACGAGQGSKPIVAGECTMRCERSKKQLMQDFGVLQVSCWDSQMYWATSSQQCECLFQERWGVISDSSITCP